MKGGYLTWSRKDFDRYNKDLFFIRLFKFQRQIWSVSNGAGPVHLSGEPEVTTVYLLVRSLVSSFPCSVLFVGHCLTYPVLFGHCIVVCLSIYGFWLNLWYLHAFLQTYSRREQVKQYLNIINEGWLEIWASTFDCLWKILERRNGTEIVTFHI
jgi:hypothetical protein